MDNLKSFESFSSDRRVTEQVNADNALAFMQKQLGVNKVLDTGDSSNSTSSSSTPSNVTIKPSRDDEFSCPNHDCWTHFGKEGFWNGSNMIGGKKVPEIKIQKSKTSFVISYKGTPFGFLLKHAKGGKQDTIHQLLNVLTLELNPFLKENKLKPQVNNIKMDMSGSNLSVTVPLIASPSGAEYIIARRGGLGHPGDYSGLEQYRSKPGYEEAIHKSANLTEKFITCQNK